MPNLDMLAVVEKIAVLFFILLLGYVVAKRGFFPEKTTRTLSMLLVNVTQPFLILRSFDMAYSAEKMQTGLLLVAASLLIHTGALFLGKLLFCREKHPDQNRVMRYAFLFANCSFLGFPVLDAMFGEGVGVFFGTFYCIVFNFYNFSYGIALLKRGRGGKTSFFKNFLNPGIFATVAGVLLYCLHLRLPTILSDAAGMVGNMTFPLSMLVVGALLSDLTPKALFGDRRLYLFCAAKLILFPLLILGICKLFALRGVLPLVCVTMCAVPSAATSAIFAETFNSDAPFAARLVGLTTLLSVATLPAMVLLAAAVL